MATERLPLVGGPLDGMEARRVSGAWAWIDRRGRASARPVDRRALYRLGTDAAGRRAYNYAGHAFAYCGSCGAYHRKAEGGRERIPCPLSAPPEVTA